MLLGVRHLKQSPWYRMLLDSGWHGISGTVVVEKNLNKNKAPGVDGIHPSLLRELSHYNNYNIVRHIVFISELML